MRQWAVSIGISDYQSFQSLSYAQQDAQALQQFLIHDLGFPPEQCLLFTNTSLPVSDLSTYPTQATLQQWIERLIQNYLQPGDGVWLFFSGHGVCRNGQDYLVPIDGDPWAVETTCISVTELFNRLKTALPLNLLVLLDMSRSQGMLSYENAGVGIQTAQLATRLEIPTLLSCQPGQFSREVSSLGHGLFTIALLEGLRYQPDTTLAGLAQYMGDRLPELSEHYWQPSQRPVLICPPQTLHHPLLSDTAIAQPQNSPNSTEFNSANRSTQADASLKISDPAAQSTFSETASAANGTTFASGQSNSYNGNLQQQGQQVSATTVGTHRSFTATPAASSPVNWTLGNQPNYTLSRPLAMPTSIPPAVGSANPDYQSFQADSSVTASQPPPASVSPSTPAGTPANSAPVEPSAEGRDPNLWRPVLLWGGLLSLGLIGLVLWRNWSSLWRPMPQIVSQSPASVVSSPTPAPASVSTQPTSLSSATPQPSPAPLPASSDSSQPPSVASAGVSGVVDPAPPSPAIANQKETGQSPLSFSPVVPQGNVGGQSNLDRARTLIKSDQATPYRDAILEAKKIQPNDPAYAEAQQEIAGWSQTIFNIAQQRANQKAWDIAVMAADMVPVDHPQLHPQAKAAIAEWCPAVFQMPVKTFVQTEARAVCNRELGTGS